MNVMLVDDEPYELEQLQLVIKPLCPHWNLYTAVDSNQALALGKQVNFDLVFLDIFLPGKSGLEIGKELRHLNEKLDIVIITAFQDFHYAKQSIKMGVVDYLNKPVIESELIEIIQKYAAVDRDLNYSQLILDTLDIVHQRYGEKLNMVEISQEIHVNPSYLSRKFSEEVGVPFSDYVMNYRIEIAKSLLMTHLDWSISHVAETAGFTSQHYFSTLFRKKTGITPREYRDIGK